MGAPGPDFRTWDKRIPSTERDPIYDFRMSNKLVRYQQTGDYHFLTFSCYHRQPYLADPCMRKLFEHSLETVRQQYAFFVFGYVVMPEHVHLLLSEPKSALLSNAMKGLKLSVTLQQTKRPFWQARYYDFNVFTDEKRIEKLRYIHRNPVKRGLVEKPQDWDATSFRHHLTGEIGPVEIESWWTVARREQGRCP